MNSLILKTLKWLDDNLEEILLALLLIGISTLVIGQVVARYIFNNPLSWSDELARYFLIWCTFLSVSYCVKKRISIKIDQFQNALPFIAIPWVKMIRHTLVFVFCLIMLPFAWEYMKQSIFNGSTSPALQIPMAWIQSAPLVGFTLLSIRVLEAWIREFKISRKLLMRSLHDVMKEKKEEEV